MEEAHALLARLDRIEALDREGAPPARLLPELRALVREAEAWARRERDPARRLRRPRAPPPAIRALGAAIVRA